MHPAPTVPASKRSAKPHLQNPHYLKYDLWRRTIAARVLARRGGAVALALYLGVSRQSVHRWLRGPTPMPGWAAVAVNMWWQRAHTMFPAVLFPEPVRLGRDKRRLKPKPPSAWGVTNPHPEGATST